MLTKSKIEEIFEKYVYKFAQELSLNKIQEVHARQLLSDFLDEIQELPKP